MLYLSCVYDQTSTLIAMHAILNACLRGLSGGADSMAFYITPVSLVRPPTRHPCMTKQTQTPRYEPLL
jgi:hypothetical protein